MLKVKKTTYPEKPARSFNEWATHIHLSARQVRDKISAHPSKMLEALQKN